MKTTIQLWLGGVPAEIRTEQFSNMSLESYPYTLWYCHVIWSDYRQEFGLVVGFIGDFNTQLLTTLYKSLSHTD
jgi:hypothetical protein